jgi:Holliday junction resolvase
MLGMASDLDLLHAAWVLDWGREEDFRLPIGYDFPVEHLRASMGEPGRIHSWEIETLLIEALGSRKRPGRRQANPKAWNFFADVISALRSAENAEGGSAIERNIFREMNRILYRQTPWQAHNLNAAETIRWFAIFDDEELGEIYRAAVGTTPRTMLRLGLILSMVFKDAASVGHLAAIPEFDVDEHDVAAFFHVVADDLEGFRSRCEKIVSSSGLAYRESPFRQTPLVLFKTPEASHYACPLNDVLFWRVTSGLYYDVVADERARHLIGEAFERFEARLLATAYPEARVLREEPYGPKRLNKKTPDIVLAENETLKVAFECKAKRLPLANKIELSDEIRYSVAVKEIAKAVFQLVRFRADIRCGTYTDLRENPESQYVVLTLDDWVFTGPATKDDVFQLAQDMLTQKGIAYDFDIRDILFCTAVELDIIVTKFNLEQLIHIFKTNKLPAYREHAPLPLSNELFPDVQKGRKYPLISELEQIIPGRTDFR